MRYTSAVAGAPASSALPAGRVARGMRVRPSTLRLFAILAGLAGGVLPGQIPPAFAQSDYVIRGTTAATASVFVVDNSSSSCSDAGPGSSTTPYCTISAALLAHHDPGTTIEVMPGVYHEQVTIPASGLSGSPLVLQSMGTSSQPVLIDGADDFAGTARWTRQSGNVWLAAEVTWSPFQVFVDGARLAASTASPSTLPSGSFTFVSGQGLYVNIGGDNPGAHDTHVGHRLYGVFSSGKTSVVVKGFSITRAESRGIQLTGASSDVTLEGNRVTFSGHAGIQVNGGSGIVIRGNVSSDNGDHGIALLTSTTGSTIEGNESFRNAFPAGRQANGLYLFGSPGNRIVGNRFHDNQDTGEHMQSGSNDNISIQNRSWNNGDHGFDHLAATGNVHVGDVAFGNFRDGFEAEGNSTGTVLHDCIATDNGLTSSQFDLDIDGTSTSGFQSDDNLFWNSTARPPIKFGTAIDTSVAKYSAASGQDGNTFQANPLFTDPANGNFELRAGSPCIDDANSGVANWPSTDALGRARVDDAGTPNRGRGPVTFADRGALEFQGSTAANQPPVARLTVTPSSGTAPLTVTASGSASSDADGTIASYRFDFGDGTVVGPQAGANAQHTFAAGTWTVRLTVTDDKGATGTASAVVTASAPNQPPVARLTVTPSSGTAPLAVTASGSASSDADGTIASYRFDFGDGTVVGPQAAASATHTFAAGTWTVRLTVTDNQGATSTASAVVT